MNTRLDTLLRAAVLGASGLMLYQKLSSGTIAFYINQRFEWLVLIGALLYLALALTLIYQVVYPSQRSLAQILTGQPRSARSSWSAILLLAIPAFVGYLAPARPLSASAIGARGIGLQSAPGRTADSTLSRPLNGPRTILDWLRASASNSPDSLTGQQADVTGFVYRDDPRFGANQFMVSRFSVSCCVADAAAFGLIVESDSSSKFAQNQWVRVAGRFTTRTFANEKIAVIAADTIEAIEQPEQPYIYP